MPRILHQLEQLSAGLIALMALGGCSGGLPALSPGGYVVEPSRLRQFTSGGSLSTLWYRGSDANYHYFSHLVKVRTNYRVKRSDLTLNEADEFLLGTRDSALVAQFRNPSLVASLHKDEEAEQAVDARP